MRYGMYVVAPLVAVGVLVALATLLFRVPEASQPAEPDRHTPADPGDFGLLRPAATVADDSSAQALRELLSTAGIRSTTAPGRHGRVHVMVFQSELYQARRVVHRAP